MVFIYSPSKCTRKRKSGEKKNLSSPRCMFIPKHLNIKGFIFSNNIKLNNKLTQAILILMYYTSMKKISIQMSFKMLFGYSDAGSQTQ